MTSEIYHQARLESGTTTRVSWVNKAVKVGDQITLKNSEQPDRLWNVTWVSDNVRDKEELGIRHGWHVGGL